MDATKEFLQEEFLQQETSYCQPLHLRLTPKSCAAMRMRDARDGGAPLQCTKCPGLAPKQTPKKSPEEAPKEVLALTPESTPEATPEITQEAQSAPLSKEAVMSEQKNSPESSEQPVLANSPESSEQPVLANSPELSESKAGRKYSRKELAALAGIAYGSIGKAILEIRREKEPLSPNAQKVATALSQLGLSWRDLKGRDCGRTEEQAVDGANNTSETSSVVTTFAPPVPLHSGQAAKAASGISATRLPDHSAFGVCNSDLPLESLFGALRQRLPGATITITL